MKNTNSSSNLADFFKTNYPDEYKQNVFSLWKIFLHFLSIGKGLHKGHDKFKILSLVKFIEGKLYFLCITTDKLNAKHKRLKNNHAILVPRKTVNCLKKDSIIDPADIDEIPLERANELLSETRIEKERLKDFKEKLPEPYITQVVVACSKLNPSSQKTLFTLREIAGIPVNTGKEMGNSFL